MQGVCDELITFSERAAAAAAAAAASAALPSDSEPSLGLEGAIVRRDAMLLHSNIMQHSCIPWFNLHLDMPPCQKAAGPALQGSSGEWEPQTCMAHICM